MINMLSVQFNVLSIVGIWCPPNWLSNRLVFLFRFYSCIVIILMYTLGLSQLARIILLKHNFSDFNDTFFILLSTNFACFKATCNLLTQRRVLKLISMFKKNCCIAQDSIEKHIQKKYDKNCRIIELGLLTVVEITAFCMIIAPLNGGIHRQELIYKVLVPYDLSNSLIYWLTFIHHSIGAILFTSISITTDAMIAGFMLQLCSQLKFLKHRIKMIPFYVIKFRKNISKDLIQEMERQLIAQNVKHHVHILRIAETLDSTFNEIATCQFIVSALSICVSVYQISAEKESVVKLLIYILYLWCMLVQFFLYCYFGNEVLIQSQSLSLIIFDIDWSSLSLKLKKDLIFIILRSSKPIEMFNGIFVHLTLESFTNIVKKSYSVFTVLKQSV